jgi:hypothetical protein
MDQALERLDFGGLDHRLDQMTAETGLHYLHDILSARSFLALFLAYAW